MENTASLPLLKTIALALALLQFAPAAPAHALRPINPDETNRGLLVSRLDPGFRAGTEEVLKELHRLRTSLGSKGITLEWDDAALEDPALWPQEEKWKLSESFILAAAQRREPAVPVGWGLELRFEKDAVILLAPPAGPQPLGDYTGFALFLRNLSSKVGAEKLVLSEKGVFYEKRTPAPGLARFEAVFLPPGLYQFLRDRNLTLTLMLSADGPGQAGWDRLGELLDPRNLRRNIPILAGTQVFPSPLPVSLMKGPSGKPLAPLTGYVGELELDADSVLRPVSFLIRSWMFHPGIVPLDDHRYQVDLKQFSGNHPTRRLLSLLRKIGLEQGRWNYGIHGGGSILDYLQGRQPTDLDVIPLLPYEEADRAAAELAQSQDSWLQEVFGPLAQALGVPDYRSFFSDPEDGSIPHAAFEGLQVDGWSNPVDPRTGKELRPSKFELSVDRLVLLPDPAGPDRAILLDNSGLALRDLEEKHATLVGDTMLSHAVYSSSSGFPQRYIFRFARRMAVDGLQFDPQRSRKDLEDIGFIRNAVQSWAVPKDPAQRDELRKKMEQELSRLFRKSHHHPWDAKDILGFFGIYNYLFALGLKEEDVVAILYSVMGPFLDMRPTKPSALEPGPKEGWWDEFPEIAPILARYPNPELWPEVLYGKTEPESVREHVRAVLRVMQLLAAAKEVGEKEQRLLRIGVALHDIGTYANSGTAAAIAIVDLAREKIRDPQGRPVPFRARDLADHYGLAWETSGGLLDRVKQDLADRPPQAGESLDTVVAEALAARGTAVDFSRGDPVSDRIRDDETALNILGELERGKILRFQTRADRQMVEAIVRASVWAGLLETQPGYTAQLEPGVAGQAKALSELMETADVVEASVNLSLAEAFYQNRPRDLRNLLRSLEVKVQERALSLEMVDTVLRLLDPAHPLHDSFLAILSKSRRIGKAGQTWSELDRSIMTHSQRISAEFKAGKKVDDILAGLAQLAGLEERMPAWLKAGITAEELERRVTRGHETMLGARPAAVLFDPELVPGLNDADREETLLQLERQMRSAFALPDEVRFRIGLLGAKELWRDFQVVEVKRHPEGWTGPLPLPALPVVVTEALASPGITLYVDPLVYAGLRELTLPQVLADLTDLFA